MRCTRGRSGSSSGATGVLLVRRVGGMWVAVPVEPQRPRLQGRILGGEPLSVSPHGRAQRAPPRDPGISLKVPELTRRSWSVRRRSQIIEGVTSRSTTFG